MPEFSSPPIQLLHALPRGLVFVIIIAVFIFQRCKVFLAFTLAVRIVIPPSIFTVAVTGVTTVPAIVHRLPSPAQFSHTLPQHRVQHPTNTDEDEQGADD